MSTAAIPQRSRILNRAIAENIEKASSANEEKALIDDAKQSPREKKLARTKIQAKAVIARKENRQVPADQDKNPPPHNEIDKGGAIKSAIDVNGKEKETQKQSLDALKTWAESYTSTRSCNSTTKETIRSIVQTVEQALKDGQTAVDLTSHAGRFSGLRSTHQKLLRSALEKLPITGLPQAQTGLPEAQEKTASPQQPLTTDDPNTELEKTAPTDAQSTPQLSGEEVVQKFEQILGEYFDRALEAGDTRNLQHDLDEFTEAFLKPRERCEVQTPADLNEISNEITTIMSSMLSHVDSRIDFRMTNKPEDLLGMKSLLIKLQGKESMQGMHSIWEKFASTWNQRLPNGVSKIPTNLVHFDKLQTKIKTRLPADYLPVEKALKAALPYNQETAWAAYNEEYKKFRIETLHNKLMDFAKKDWTSYIQSFKIITADGSGLSADTAQQMVLQRSLVDFVSFPTRNKTAPETNKAILGCTNSYFDDHPAESAQEVAFIMKTPMIVDGVNAIKNVTVLTLTAPPLDDTNHPIWNNFVDEKGKLNEEVYSKHYRSLCSLIKQASDQNPDKRVVMSAVGMGAFVSALSPDQQEVARDIAANHLAQLAKALSDEGRHVAYSDINVSSQNAVKIQKSVIKNGMAPLHFVGKLPGDWMNDGDLYINAGDPHSCAGNGGSRDDSLEGKLGRFNLMSDIHVQVAINAQLAKTAQQ